VSFCVRPILGLVICLIPTLLSVQEAALTKYRYLTYVLQASKVVLWTAGLGLLAAPSYLEHLETKLDTPDAFSGSLSLWDDK